jgi:hypothetical protein
METLKHDRTWDDIKNKHSIKVFGSVRAAEQGEIASKLYGLTPLMFDQTDQGACSKVVVENDSKSRHSPFWYSEIDLSSNCGYFYDQYR